MMQASLVNFLLNNATDIMWPVSCSKYPWQTNFLSRNRPHLIFFEAAKICTSQIRNIHAAAEDGVVRWLVPANNRLSHFRRDENLKKERIKNKTSHMLQAKNNSFLCKLCYIFALEVQNFADQQYQRRKNCHKSLNHMEVCSRAFGCCVSI